MKFLLTIYAALFFYSTLGQAKLDEALWVSDPDKSHISIFQNHGDIVIDHVSDAGYEVYGPVGTAKYMDKLGLIYSWQEEVSFYGKNEYPSYEDITNSLREIVARHPDIMKMYSIGKSVQGRDLWVVKVSDNVATDETEPEFKYISSMHGDEIVGRELMVRFLRDIGQEYQQNDYVKSLVDSTEIFIMPSMNPDGSERAKRWNANNVDLNRDFPDFTSRDDNSVKGREPETKAVMNFQKERSFSLSANFHGGAVVVNYPWDSTYDLHPLDDLIVNFSTAYASFNEPMRNSNEFPGGIVNGARWYVVRGGMQDWSSHFYGDLQVTIELSDIKWPDYSRIEQFYLDNKRSLYHYIYKIHHGTGFKFKTKTAHGTVRIKNIDKDNVIDLGSFGFQKGEFYKVLPKGRYLFEIKSNHYQTSLELGVNGKLDAQTHIAIDK